MGYFMNEIMYYVNRSNAQHWLLVLIAVVVIGLFSMRGFGSRSQY